MGIGSGLVGGLSYVLIPLKIMLTCQADHDWAYAVSRTQHRRSSDNKVDSEETSATAGGSQSHPVDDHERLLAMGPSTPSHRK
jgi:hypothetical protein